MYFESSSHNSGLSSQFLRQMPDGSILFSLPPSLSAYASTAGAQTNPADYYPWGGIMSNHPDVPQHILDRPHSELERIDYYTELGINGLRADLFAISKHTVSLSQDGLCQSSPNQLSNASLLAEERLKLNGIGINWQEVEKSFEVMLSLDARFMRTIITLFHWDWPHGVKDGWQDSRMVEIFCDYYTVIFYYLRDRFARLGRDLREVLPLVILANEPAVFAGNMAITRMLEPNGGQLSLCQYKKIISHLALAAEATRKAIAQVDPLLCFAISNNLADFNPYPATSEIVLAINKWLIQMFTHHDQNLFHQMMQQDPKLLASNTLFILAMQFLRLPRSTLPQNLVVALNYWHSRVVDIVGRKSDRSEWLSELGWHLDPRGLLNVLSRVSTANPGVPIYITELGSHFPDADDDQKLEYILLCLVAIATAIERGVDVRMVGLWGVIDNIEWLDGMRRSGVYGVDDSGTIYPRNSAKVVADLLKTGSIILPAEWASKLADLLK